MDLGAVVIPGPVAKAAASMATRTWPKYSWDQVEAVATMAPTHMGKEVVGAVAS